MIQGYQQVCQKRVDGCLEALFSAPLPQLERLYQAMRYSVMNGGKRVRPLLAYAACEALGGDKAQADGAACAVELIHAYSLVHDDLPAMDDDDLRRGQPTTHKAYDEACAILAGDGLQSLAFEVLASPRTTRPTPPCASRCSVSWRGQPARPAWSVARRSTSARSGTSSIARRSS